jgi:hypothetical protein
MRVLMVQTWITTWGLLQRGLGDTFGNLPARGRTVYATAQ